MGIETIVFVVVIVLIVLFVMGYKGVGAEVPHRLRCRR